MIRLFELDIKNNVIATEHCYVIKWLKVIIDNNPKDHVKKFAYIFYMSYMGKENPYFNTKEGFDEDTILSDLDIDDSDVKSDEIQIAVKKCKKMYETPTSRAYKGISTMLDNLSDYMATTQIEHGRDGNISALISAAKNFQAIRESFNGTKKDLDKEQSQKGRGGQQLGYDQL